MEKLDYNQEKQPKQQFVSIIDLYHQQKHKIEEYLNNIGQNKQKQTEHQDPHKQDKNQKYYEIEIYEDAEDDDDDDEYDEDDEINELYNQFYYGNKPQKQKQNYELVSKNNDSENMRKQNIPQGTFYSSSISITQSIGSDGKKHVQTYQSNSMAQRGADGQQISEKQVAYRNSDGIEKMAKERFLNGKGASYFQEKDANGQVLVSSKFHNLKQNEQVQFVSEWMNYSQKIGFQQAFYRFVQPDFSTNKSIMNQNFKNSINGDYDFNLVKFHNKKDNNSGQNNFNLANYYFNSLKSIKKNFV